MNLKNLFFFFMTLVLSSCSRGGIIPPLPDVIPMDMDPVVDPSGRFIVYLHATIDTTDTSGLHILDLETWEKKLLPPGDARNPDFSPDGRWLVFNGGDQIFKVRLKEDMRSVDTLRLSQLTYEGKNYFPAWSRDGEWIAYTWSYGMKLYSVSGGSTISLIDFPAMDPAWFPDSRRLVFSALNSDKTKFVLWRINIDGTGLEQITF